MIESDVPNRLLTEKETAHYLGLRPQTLATWRSAQRYPLPFVKVGRAIRYRRADIEKFLFSRTVVGGEIQDLH